VSSRRQYRRSAKNLTLISGLVFRASPSPALVDDMVRIQFKPGPKLGDRRGVGPGGALGRPTGKRQTMKVYLDNDVVSAVAKDDYAAESAALERLLAAYRDGKVDLVTSTVTLKEIESYQEPQQPAIKQIFRSLKKVPNACIPMIRNDPLYDDLLKRGLETIDAWHVFVAAQNGCHAFLTCDRLIHHYSAAIMQICSLVVQKPSDFVSSQGWRCGPAYIV